MRLLTLSTTIALGVAVSGCLPIMFDRDWNWRGTEPPRPAFGSMIDAAAAEDDAAAEEDALPEEMTVDDDAAVDNETVVDGEPVE